MKREIDIDRQRIQDKTQIKTLFSLTFNNLDMQNCGCDCDANVQKQSAIIVKN